MSNQFDRIETRAKISTDCPFVVQVLRAESRHFLGTAFFISSTAALTCRHIIEVRDANNKSTGQCLEEMILVLGKHEIHARLAFASEKKMTDLACLVVTDAPPHLVIPTVRLAKDVNFLLFQQLVDSEKLFLSSYQQGEGRHSVVRSKPIHETQGIDVQFPGGWGEGASGSPLLAQCGDQWVALGMAYLGGEGSATSRALTADAILRELSEQWEVKANECMQAVDIKGLAGKQAIKVRDSMPITFPLSGCLFDAVLDIDVDGSSGFIDERIRGRLSKKNPKLSIAHAYYTNEGARHWLELCDSHLYRAYQDSIELLLGNRAQIINAIGGDFLRQSPDFISLGVGNGKKDALLLNSIIEHLPESSPKFYYYPVDISRALLSCALKRVIKESRLTGRIMYKPILGEFKKLRDLRQVFEVRDVPKIFSCLGNTLGNARDEITRLEDIKDTMEKGDVLLLEVRRRNESCEDTLNMANDGNLETRYKMSFAPLERLGAEYNQEQFKVVILGDKDNNDINRSRIKKACTRIMYYNNAEIKEGNVRRRIPQVELSRVSCYDTDELQKTLINIGFKDLGLVKHKSMALFIVRRED